MMLDTLLGLACRLSRIAVRLGAAMILFAALMFILMGEILLRSGIAERMYGALSPGSAGCRAG